MIEFFGRATANIQTGDSSNIRELLETHHQQQSNGLIEINFEQRGWIDVLLLNGEVVGTYYLTPTSSNPISVSELDKWWHGESAQIRSVELPGEAVRITGMVCEWHPPTQSLLIQSSGLQNILQVFLINKISGLLLVSDSTGELAVPVIDGFTLATEAVYSGSQFMIGPNALSQGLQSSSHNCTVVLYEARPDTVSFKQLILRQVVSELTGTVLARYSQIVGGGLLGAMGNELNQFLRGNRLQMQLVGERLDNAHIFKSIEEATHSYSVLFKALNVHMTHVIGGGLACSLQKEAYRNLNPRSQAAIDEQTILSSVQR
jgi:hypothetical protein